MGRLFWKIFLWFWLTLLLIAALVISGTAVYFDKNDNELTHQLQTRFVHHQSSSIQEIIELSGETAAARWLMRPDPPHIRQRILVVDELGYELLNRHYDINSSKLHYLLTAVSPEGEEYFIYSQQLHSSKNRRASRNTSRHFIRIFKGRPGIVVMWISIALGSSLLVCVWLAWYLTRPIRTLRRASHQLASGNLDIRVADSMGTRRDEIADLGKDFDQMANHLQQLIGNQKQLLSDISHELRSPLARLQVAVGLAQKKAPPELSTQLERIERESERLEDLVSQVLTLSRLEAGANSSNVYRREDYLTIESLLKELVGDCDFEANDQGKSVHFEARTSGMVEVNEELLRRALENVIRNAIRHTADGTEVLVRLMDDPKSNKHFLIEICDHGPGVKEELIDTLFEPFVRLQEARDRSSGGYGLGLAIAKRSVQFHQGSISARNREDGGLCVFISIERHVSD